MDGVTAVYVAFSICLASIFAYVFLLSRRQKEMETEVKELLHKVTERTKPK